MSNEQIVEDDMAERESHLTMEVLHAVAEDARLSQRGLAARLNVALGLTNGYLKRCVRKGLIKVQKIPPNRYAYYLTPKGFAEKTKLTADYLYNSLRFYRRARNQCDELLSNAADRGHRRIAIAGAGDLAEIALLCALQHEVEVVGVADDGARANRFRHVPLVRDLESLAPFDAVLICDVADAQATYDALTPQYAVDRLMAPKLLKVATDRGGESGR
jgi:DNA-binding MarR family transcriptional regulator